MIRIGLLDTTVPGVPGSMARYRDQLLGALREHCSDRVEVDVESLGCAQETLSRTPRRLQMWRRHHHVWRSAKTLDTGKYDLVHLLDGSFGYVAGAVATDRVVVTVHDVIPRLQMDGVFAEAPGIGRGASWIINKSLRGVRSAGIVCADSQSTANDLKDYGCGDDESILVVPLAIEQELFASRSVSSESARSDAPFLFHLGNNGFYKNRTGAIEIFRRLAPDLDVRLVLAGPPPDAALDRAYRQSGLQDRITFIENPSQERLAQLYRSASVFLFPSIYEGFGWPPLEAMAAGCPVVASDAGSLGEVVGDAGLACPAGQYDAMAAACSKLLTEDGFRNDMIRRGLDHAASYSPHRLALAMMQVYSQVVEG